MTFPLPSTMYHPSPLHNVPSLSPPQRTISLPSTTYPQDHMWQHRQEERDLRRTETDIVKQRKQVQRSMKEYEASECNLYIQQTDRISLSRPLLVELWFACKILQIETDNPPFLPPSLPPSLLPPSSEITRRQADETHTLLEKEADLAQYQQKDLHQIEEVRGR